MEVWALVTQRPKGACHGQTMTARNRRRPGPGPTRPRAEGTTEAAEQQCVALPADRQQKDESRRVICGHALRG